MEAATAHTHTHAYVYPLVLANFSPARSFGLCCRLFVAAVELKALACYTLWNQLQSCHAPWTLTPCHAPHTTPFEAQVFMFVLARRRLIKSLASELPGPPGPPHFLSKVTSSPANVIFPFTFLPKKKKREKPPAILLACLCHKLQLEIVRNYIKFLLPHTWNGNAAAISERDSKIIHMQIVHMACG